MRRVQTRCVRRLAVCVALAACVSSLWPSVSLGDDPQFTFALLATQHEIARLAPAPDGPLSAQVAFVVDDVGDVTVVIDSTNGEITTSITSPAGEINQGTIGDFGGELLTYGDMEETESGIMPGLFFGPGFKWVYLFPSPGPGSYTINLNADPALDEEVAVVITTILDSSVVTTLVTTRQTLTVGQSVVVTAAVFEETAPVGGATVSARVLTPSETELNPAVIDSGVLPDYEAGDGLYSGMFQVTEVGEYIISVEITGDTSLGTPFERHNATTVEVIEPSATLPPSLVLVDYGVDDTNPPNDLYDRLVIEAQNVDVGTPGTYAMRVLLETTEQNTLVGYGERELAVGLDTIAASIPAADIRAVNEDGPYTIKHVELFYLGSGGLVLVDEIANGTQLTQPYLVSDFERAAIELVGVDPDFATDTDADTDFDTLTVPLLIDVLDPGEYSYQATLADSCTRQIETVSGTQSLTFGSPETVNLVFTGSLIGANGMNGPYVVRDLFVWGPMGGGATASLTVSEVHETQAYPANEFDSYAPFVDCQPNGTPDLCDLVNGTSTDCNFDFVPDECEPDKDCNHNGTHDSCDIRNETSQDVNDNDFPDECEPPILYVNGALTTGYDNGTSWENAFKDLQGAIGVAERSLGVVDEIWVAAETYTPDRGTGDRSASFPLASDVGIYGGFVGDETSVDQRDPTVNVTILSGDLNGDDESTGTKTDNSEHVVTASGTDDTALLDGFTITGGFTTQSTAGGGGIFCETASPTISNCAIAGNVASFGAGMYAWHSSPRLLNCAFTDNEATLQGGGAINVFGGTVNAVNCVFAENRAETDSGDGGGIFCCGHLVLTNCTFFGNSAGRDGGGVYAILGTVLISNSILWHNTSHSGAGSSPDAQLTVAGGSVSVIHSCIQDEDPNDGSIYPGPGNIDDDPQFFDSNGEEIDLHLYASSPCIEKGDNSFVTTVETDLDGNPRLHDADQDPEQLATVDLGAFEFQCGAVEAPEPDEGDEGAVWLDEGSGTRNRYISFMPPAQEAGIRIRLAESTLFPDAVGLAWWVGEPSVYCENAGQSTLPDPNNPPNYGCGPASGAPRTFIAARLRNQCAAYYRDWTESEAVHVYDNDIVPSDGVHTDPSSFFPTVYEIQAIAPACNPDVEGNYSVPIRVTTSKWGDIAGGCDGISYLPANGIVDILDSTAILDKFRNYTAAPRKARADIEPVIPDQEVNITDVNFCFDAFRGFAYPFSGPQACQEGGGGEPPPSGD